MTNLLVSITVGILTNWADVETSTRHSPTGMVERFRQVEILKTNTWAELVWNGETNRVLVETSDWGTSGRVRTTERRRLMVATNNLMYLWP